VNESYKSLVFGNSANIDKLRCMQTLSIFNFYTNTCHCHRPYWFRVSCRPSGKLTARWPFGTHGCWFTSPAIAAAFCVGHYAESSPLLVTNAIFALNERKAPSFVKRFPEEAAASSRNSCFQVIHLARENASQPTNRRKVLGARAGIKI
jgi:hypothetical protein